MLLVFMMFDFILFVKTLCYYKVRGGTVFLVSLTYETKNSKFL